MALPARIKVGALPTDVVTGKVARIAPQAQQKDGATLFDVEIELDPATNDRRCAPATRPTRTSSSARSKDVLTIPERVVTFEDGGKKTFVELPGANREGRRRRRPRSSSASPTA